ncbi:protein phosphatase 2C Ptc1 [Schizosaccharomyces octosporus yFS286]|uniref:Protein phosphatase 2C Ptc1 n=1 Tax=Schizosaccharomyces octosporus (strain yFS286) TaxID=483514 RepID=S9Q1I1_SCHOY|nr:protein phosphatase 2C Ptc1 [Schizosaccharomyces octosporus yFS286]EPX73573.1 protein phosphatase 2C Ptc1 [Schizosaccharomyces octosporus yFS286]
MKGHNTVSSALLEPLQKMNPFKDSGPSNHARRASISYEEGEGRSHLVDAKDSEGQTMRIGSTRPSKTSNWLAGMVEDKNQRWRRAMEDAHSCWYDFGGNQDDGFIGVYDGHAGAQASDYCKKVLHKILLEKLRKYPDRLVTDLLDETFVEVNDSIAKETKNDVCGCTSAIAFFRYENNRSRRVLYTANVGDARVVLCRDGKAIRLSYDHKGSDENEARRVTQLGGAMVQNRINGVLAVTRALGDTYLKELVSAHPFTTETRIWPGHDEFFIVACDGLWDVISDQEAVDFVRKFTSCREAALRLVEHALKRLSTDNITCIVVNLTRAPGDVDEPGVMVDSNNDYSNDYY